jgi:hypothetical protein
MNKLLLCVVFIGFAVLVNAQLYNKPDSTGLKSVGKEEMVMTPGGPALKSNVHYVDSRHHINIKDGHIQVINNKTGIVEQEFDNASTTDNSKSQASKLNMPDDNGWVTYSYWHNTDTAMPFHYFSTNWIVPNPPVTNSGQTVFLFNALEEDLHGAGVSTNYIIQPVLQWGGSAAGGGSYWAIADWFGPNSSDVYVYDSLIPVNSGTNLQGIIKFTFDSSNHYSYNSSFAGYAGSGLQVDNITRPNYAYETLEAYNMTQCTDYPADTAVRLTGINIKTDSIYPTLTWTVKDTIFEYAQHTAIVSNSSDTGEVDIYFHTPCTSAGIAGSPGTSDEISLYPNPATNNISIESPLQAIIEIINIQGQLLKTLTVVGQKTTVDVSPFPSGVYIVEVRTDKGIEVKKFVKE